MKQIKNAAHPSNFLFFDTETRGKPSPHDKSIVRHYFWFGVAIAYRYVDGKKTRYKEVVFNTLDEFWLFVASRLDKSRPLYIFAHNLGFDLTITDFWLRCPEMGLNVRYAVLEDLPTFLDCVWSDASIIFVDSLNYWRTSLAELGKSFGLEKMKMPSLQSTEVAWQEYCKRDVEIISEAVSGLINYLTEKDLGPFAMTAPSIAMKVYRHKFMDHEIFVHDDIHTLDLERDSYYGGLVNNYYIGDMHNKPIHHYDVNSLYPSCMLGLFPHKLVERENTITPARLLRAMKSYGAVARVNIRSNSRAYPYRHNNKLLEVTGEYTTTLCGPELEKALFCKDVVSVDIAALYDMAPIFRSFVEFFWKERVQYKEQNDQVKQIFVKLLMNQLYGKFGQRGYEWKELDKRTIREIYAQHNKEPPSAYLDKDFQPDILWQQMKWFPLGLSEPITVRSLGGLVQVRLPIGEHFESCPIIAAYVTSYARTRLHQLIDICGPKQVYYCDTDSLFVSNLGESRLKRSKEINPAKIGYLKHEGDYRECSFFGPKDYSVDGKTVLKGIRQDAFNLGNGEYMQNQFEGLKSVLRRNPEPFIEIAWINKLNRRIFTKGTVGTDGWVKPFRLPCDLPK